MNLIVFDLSLELLNRSQGFFLIVYLINLFRLYYIKLFTFFKWFQVKSYFFLISDFIFCKLILIE